MKVTKEQLKWYGRNFDYDGIRFFNYSNSAFEFCFTGKKAVAEIVSNPESVGEKNLGVLAIYIKEIGSPKEYKGDSYWDCMADEPAKKIVLKENENQAVLFESSDVKTVVIKVIKISEVPFGQAGFKSLELDGKLVKKNYKKSVNADAYKIEFIGDSITCGYGIEGVYMKDVFDTQQERSDKAYAFLTAKKLGAEFHCVSFSGIGIISQYVDPSVENPNTVISMPLLWPYTDKVLSKNLGLEPEIWDERKFSPDLIVINLGTNDASYVREVEGRRLSYVHGLRLFIEEIHRRSPKAKICCCLGVMGQQLCDSVFEAVDLFKKDFKDVKIKAVKLPLQDEKNDGVSCDWHPSALTHQKTAEFFAKEINPDIF